LRSESGKQIFKGEKNGAYEKASWERKNDIVPIFRTGKGEAGAFRLRHEECMAAHGSGGREGGENVRRRFFERKGKNRTRDDVCCLSLRKREKKKNQQHLRSNDNLEDLCVAGPEQKEESKVGSLFQARAP